ncbi:hypothetical protein N7460_008061 [Penicillium canescens]|uniref:Uncharacterized protein n=1 Tax=Penicillium canescens TaxID=5083 RepID=A0AAD6IA79_PENCN|nr:hypothetical protein N7460_008061 [Penicillium canescens]
MDNSFVQSGLADAVELVRIYSMLQEQKNDICMAIRGCCTQGLFSLWRCSALSENFCHGDYIALARSFN